MLQLIRDNAQGWLAWVIVVLICVPFALWGVQEYLGVDPNVTVAEINGEELGLQRYQHAYQRNRAQLRVAVDDPVVEEQLKLDTIERLVQDEVIVQAAAQHGLRISDQQLSQAIQGQAAFQENGAFSPRLYDVFVRNQGFSPGGFESNYRRTLLAEQFFSGLSNTAFATDSEAQSAALLETQTRTYEALRIARDAFMDVEVPAADVEAYYELNKAEFDSEETVQLAYIVLTKKALEAGVKLDEDMLRSNYEERRATFRSKEELRARHILVTVARDADEAAEKAAEERAGALRAKLDAGEDFADLAKAESGDKGSASKGGDLGYFERGWMTPEFEAAAFAMQAGELSEPVRSPFGFHIIKVEEKRGGDLQSFEEVRPQLEADFRAEEAERAFYGQADSLENLAYEQPDNLDVASDTLGLPIQTTDFITRAGVAADDILSDPSVMRAAFTDEVLRGGNNSEPVTLADGSGVVVLRVLEHKPSAEQPLDVVREQVAQRLRRDRAGDAVEKLGNELVKQLRGGTAEADVATEAKAEWATYEDVKRRDRGPGAEERSLAFKMPRPSGDKPVVDGVAAPGGDYIIVSLEKVVDEPGDEKQLENIRNLYQAGMTRSTGGLAFQNLLDALRDASEVVVHEERL